MIIESLSIKSFGMITDLTLDFTKGMNVIVGQNESGKSTIAAFIKYMLYGFGNETTPIGMPDERAKRVNWNNGTAQGSMTVRVGDKRYLITRSSVRTENGPRPTYKEDSAIVDLETGSPAFGKAPAGEVFFGVDKELFENTAFVGQISDSSIDEGSVKQSIENILFSGNERINNQRAASKIAVKMENLFHKGGSGGAIYELRKKTEQLEDRFKIADGDNKLILAKEAELHSIRAERREQIAVLDKLTDLDECYRNVIVIQSFDELHELEGKSDAISEKYNAFVEANTRAGYVPDDQYVKDLAYTRRAVDGAYRTLIEADEAYAKEKREAGITAETEGQIAMCDTYGGEAVVISKAKKLRKRWISSLALSILGALVALAAIVFEVAATGTLAEVIFRVLFALVGLGGVGLTGFSVRRLLASGRELSDLEDGFATESLDDLISKLSVIEEERNKRDKLARDKEDARITFERAKESYEAAKAALLEVILRWGEEPPASNLNEFLDGIEDKANEYLREEKAILDEKNEVEIAVRELRRHLQDKSEIDIRAQVSPLKRKVLSEIDHESMLLGIEDCKLKIAEKERLAEAVEAELAMLKLRATDPGELYSKMQENDSRIEGLILQYEACELAKKTIESASENLRSEISPRLGEYSAALMQIMTDKKYSDIDVSDGLKVSFVGADGEHRSVDFLSGGTRDMTYISLRMALIDMLYTELPPVCFDESFAHQDNARATSMMRAIKSLADSGQQSFIFTCREREAHLAREIAKDTVIYKLTTGDED